MVKLDRLWREALVEKDAKERSRGNDITQGVVRVAECDAAPGADRREAMVVGERLEQAERVQGARDP